MHQNDLNRAFLLPILLMLVFMPASAISQPNSNIQGIIDYCQKDIGPYCAQYNCTEFANCFHVTCNELGLDCKTIIYHCDKTGGHAINLVKDPDTGLWYVVDTVAGIIIPSIIFTGPSFVTWESMCHHLKQNGYNKIKDCDDCTMTIYDDPQEPFRPHSCAKYWRDEIGLAGSELRYHCKQCCQDYAKGKNPVDFPGIGDWVIECENSCDRYSR